MSELTELKGHTPGPWVEKRHYPHSGAFIYPASDARQIVDEEIASILVGEYSVPGEWEANAALITAAPDLLEIANDLAKKLASAGQPQQAYAAFASRGLAPPASVRRAATGEDA